MAFHTYAPLVTQFTAEAPAKGSVRRYLSAFFRSHKVNRNPRHAFCDQHIARGGHSEGLDLVEREANRIRLQSRHWLM